MNIRKNIVKYFPGSHGRFSSKFIINAKIFVCSVFPNNLRNPNHRFIARFKFFFQFGQKFECEFVLAKAKDREDKGKYPNAIKRYMYALDLYKELGFDESRQTVIKHKIEEF